MIVLIERDFYLGEVGEDAAKPRCCWAVGIDIEIWRLGVVELTYCRGSSWHFMIFKN